MAERLFSALAGHTPNQAHLTGDGDSLSISQLLAAADGLAGQLARLDCCMLAVLADNSPSWVAADLATLLAGIVHLPLPNFFSAAQLRHVLADTGADALLTDRPAAIAQWAEDFDSVGTWRGLHLLKRNRKPSATPAGTWKISFTSGSTGAPKGACLSAAGLIDTAAAVAEALAEVPLRKHLAVLPLALLLENVAGVYAPLLRGMSVHLPPLASLGWRGMGGLNIADLHAQVQASSPDSMILVPELLKAWTGHLQVGAARVPECLGVVAVGGARCHPQLIASARSHGLPVYEGYGLTECGSVVALNRPGADRPGSVGRPLSHVGVAVEDGQVQVANRTFLGYLGGASGTPSPWPTGDLGRLDEAGFLHLTGRERNIIITGYGRNISPEWVEAALTAQPVIAQAVVAGEARPFLTALLVPIPGSDHGALANAVAAANAGLPDYAQVRHWLVVPPFSAADGLLTGNGRPRRDAILVRFRTDLDQLYCEKLPEDKSL